MIFIYKFSVRTRCSNATVQDFDGVKTEERIIKLTKDSMKIKRNVAWSFYGLEAGAALAYRLVRFGPVHFLHFLIRS